MQAWLAKIRLPEIGRSPPAEEGRHRFLPEHLDELPLCSKSLIPCGLCSILLLLEFELTQPFDKALILDLVLSVLESYDKFFLL